MPRQPAQCARATIAACPQPGHQPLRNRGPIGLTPACLVREMLCRSAGTRSWTKTLRIETSSATALRLSDDPDLTSPLLLPKTDRTMAKTRSTKPPARTQSKASSRATVSGPAAPQLPAAGDVLAERVKSQDLAASLPYNPNKARRYKSDAGLTPPKGPSVVPADPIVGASTVTESNGSDKTGSGGPNIGQNPTVGSARPRPRRFQQADPDHQSGRAGRRQPELAQGRAARADAARRLHPSREDHPFRPRAHPRAHRPRARVGGARLFRVLQGSEPVHPGFAVRRGRQADAGLRALLDGPRRARLDRHGARRSRLCGEVLHRGRQLGSGRQQHSDLLHPGRDEVPGPGPRGQARAAFRHAAGRRRRTTRSGTSPR